ncbi:sigma-54-dependent Fis family transcriptional regulator [Pseudochelatococcus contaminans]|uniref:Transcriptional regulator of acetoin/glycerol metabolism n=1 Tax=Pseudochelatococcus contaminans TaxID=1538103 RepID=A0A7W5Z126_9HYPH|nr:sigma-54-dependent Fis family transcriptional regulator [Pseudochelatococcus contaminans]MBB3808073.1 transcriptional regulator of acetoin/glycerol metabolism [Pseudochelatococcus contaminans]
MPADRRAINAPDKVTTARHQFFSQRKVPEALVSTTILKSWIRCSQLGHDTARPPVFEPLEARNLRERKEQHELLRRLYRMELQTLLRGARATGGIVVLSDPEGTVLDAEGDVGFAGKAATMALRPGVVWSEASIGTNAIGTAIHERRPVMVRGGEHFHEPHRDMSCAAAPIFDPTGTIMGVLDLSSHASAMPPATLSMVRLIIDQVEHRLFNDAFNDLDVVRFHTDPSLLGTARECILVFDGDRLVAANRYGLKSIAREWGDIGHTRFSDIFDAPSPGYVFGNSLRFRDNGIAHCRLHLRGGRVVPTAIPGAAEPEPEPISADGSAHDSGTAVTEPIPWPKPWFDSHATVSLNHAVRLVDADVPLLVQGETGSGKEAFARAVHACSSRADKPFIAINCAAIPESLIESELFGHEEGAFTGARKNGARGLLREANGGLLFLDEIGDMPLPLQSRLLRVLQDRQVMPLGGGRPVPLDIRIISATNQDLSELSRESRFRDDLYYRLAQFTITLSPLRERVDRRLLIERLWAEVSRGQTRLPVDVRDRLAAYEWPGNYRELVGALRALAALGGANQMSLEQCLPQALRTPSTLRLDSEQTDRGLLQHHTQDVIRSALEEARGNISMAARKLGINRSTLYRHLQRSITRQ